MFKSNYFEVDPNEELDFRDGAQAAPEAPVNEIKEHRD